MWVRALLLALLSALLAAPVAALVVVSEGGSGNTNAPADDPGWANVGRFGGCGGVYLGNGWVLTAHHVRGSTVWFDGFPYLVVRDSEIQLETGDGDFADLKVLKIQGDPGLPLLPIASTPPVVGQPVVLVANGPDRGEPIVWNEVEGWSWGTSKTMRFSTEFTSVSSPSATAHEAQAATHDSGGAAFVKNGDSWELVGDLFVVGRYDDQPAATSLYGNLTFASDLSLYREQILAIITLAGCEDGLDDDGDGLVDYPQDPGCSGFEDPYEWKDEAICRPRREPVPDAFRRVGASPRGGADRLTWKRRERSGTSERTPQCVPPAPEPLLRVEGPPAPSAARERSGRARNPLLESAR
jgi:hypothetical protein